MHPISPVVLRRCVASLVWVLLATTARAGAARANVPDGVYAELASGDAVVQCSASVKMSPTAFVKHAAAVRVLRLTSGQTIYLASIAAPKTDPCYYASRLSALVATSDGRYHTAFCCDGTLDAFHSDGTAVFMRGGESERERDRVTLRFDGTDYRESVVRIYELTGETKPPSIALHFAPGASSATVSGKVYLTFADHYELKARPGQTATISVHATSGMLGTMAMYNGYPSYITEHAPSNTWTRQLRSPDLEISVYGGEDETPTTYRMTVTIR